jgi:hypothetical protein
VTCACLSISQDENTRYVDIGPVNKVINMLACWLEDPNGEAFKRLVGKIVKAGQAGKACQLECMYNAPAACQGRSHL